MQIDNIFVARQPIYNRANKLAGYELLYRSGETNFAEFENGDRASSEVILNSFMNIGMDNLVGSTIAFVNVTEEFVLNESLSAMFETQTILEILEHIKPTKEIVAGIKRLKKQGYKIALDDFIYSAKFDVLLELADYVKFDVVEMSKAEIMSQLESIKDYNLALIAEKVETLEMYEICVELGFDYFQGYYCCYPQLVKRKNNRANKLVVLSILKKLEDEHADIQEVANAIALDATLTYKLLRYVNSASFAQRKEIDSIREALLLIGNDVVKKWSRLILMTQLAEGKPQSLLITALVRARMCELLAAPAGLQSDQLFTIGLLSLLDALMDTSMTELLDDLTLSMPLKLALLKHEGAAGDVLHYMLCYEKGKWQELIEHGVDAQFYFQCYMDAVMWADSTVEALTL